MDRAFEILTPQRVAAGLSASVGFAIGAQFSLGGYDLENGLWAGIAVLALVQLRLLLMKPSA